MRSQPPPDPAMTFSSLDEAESALDWIGLSFEEVDGAFRGTLDATDVERLDAALDDPDTPLAVRALAAALGERQRAGAHDWQVTFPA